MTFHVKKSSFEEVFPVWRAHLWPERSSEIKAISPISKDLVFAPHISESIPVFWALYSEQNELAGVVSGYKTETNLYRSRGLYVFHKFRGKKLSHQLLRAVCSQAILEDCSEVWTLPRKSAWTPYSTFGFVKKTDWFEKDMEFGPNCLATLSIYI